MPAGRKELFHTDMIKQAEVLGSFGFSLAELAHVFGVCPATISRYNKKHPELLNAFTVGKSKLRQKISHAFIREIEKGNWDAVKHGLKHLVGWKDEIALDVLQNITIRIEQGTPDKNGNNLPIARFSTPSLQ